MDLHVVKSGDSLYKIAWHNDTTMSKLVEDNDVKKPSQLSVGQALVVRRSTQRHSVLAGETLHSIAKDHHISIQQLLRNNPMLKSDSQLFPGQSLTLSHDSANRAQQPLIVLSGIDPTSSYQAIHHALPFLSALTSPPYRFTPHGVLIPHAPCPALEHLWYSEPRTILQITCHNKSGFASGILSHILLSSDDAQQQILRQIPQVLTNTNSLGLNISFSPIHTKDAHAYVQFADKLCQKLSPMSIPVIITLPARTPRTEIDFSSSEYMYGQLAQTANFVLLSSTAIDFYTPHPILSIQELRTHIEAALTDIPPEKLIVELSGCGYDWTLPIDYRRQPVPISHQKALDLAWQHRASIRYDNRSQSPWFRYIDNSGQEHEVWFEDAQSMKAKLELIIEYGLGGISVPTPDNLFAQMGLLLDSMFSISTTL